MRASWTRTAELVRMRTLLWIAVLAVPASIVWLALVGRAEPIAVALLTVGALLLGLLPSLAPRVHAIELDAHRVVLHRMLGPSTSVPRTSVDGLLLVPGMETLGGYGDALSMPRVVIVGVDGRAHGHGSWTSRAPDVQALRDAGLTVRVDSTTRRPGAVEARVPGSTTRLERLTYRGIWGLGIVLALAMCVLAFGTILLLE